MKFHHLFISMTITIFLGACNFTLAEDVTPPPDYVAPSPQPTLGPLYPASAPDISNGEIIYVEKCAPCHGDTGFGDGEQGKQLPVTVAAFALVETAHKASPANWFITVSQGNLERFMPPFDSLNEQQKWDVVSYALTLHTTPEQIELGKSLFAQASNCADCAEKFSNQKMMSALSANDLFRIIRNGQDDIPAFGINFTDDETFAVAAYLRTLTFATILPTPTTVSVISSPQGAETPISAEITPVDGTQVAATPEAVIPGVGDVSGTVQNQTGADLPSDAKVILSGFEHAEDPSVGPQEVITIEGIVNADGTYIFQNVEIPENRIYVAKVEVNGLTYQSDVAVVAAGMTELVLPPIILYATTEDFSALRIDSLQIFFDFASEGSAQIFAVYTITNTGDETVIVNMGDKQVVPFIAFPAGAEALGYEASQDSTPFIPTADGFAMPPSDLPYGLIAFASIPKAKEMVISQPALLPIDSLTLLLPEGVEATGDILIDGGMEAIQTSNFHIYTANGVGKGESFDFVLIGEPQNTAVNPDVTQNKTLLFGVGAFGAALILAGIWMFMRDRKSIEEYDDDENEFDDPESLMDAIIALDDLHRDGKLSDEAYKTRRSELKSTLKRKS
ncbi:MAG: c-type cytochrome [Anaerolineales bacterium]|nr:c-type cytochrome [Anaerolineales bacterium]